MRVTPADADLPMLSVQCASCCDQMFLYVQLTCIRDSESCTAHTTASFPSSAYIRGRDMPMTASVSQRNHKRNLRDLTNPNLPRIMLPQVSQEQEEKTRHLGVRMQLQFCIYVLLSLVRLTR